MKKNKHYITFFLAFFVYALIGSAQQAAKDLDIHNAAGRGNTARVKEILSKNPKLVNLKNKEG